MMIINDDIINDDNQLIGQRLHHPQNAVLSTYFRNSDITRCGFGVWTMLDRRSKSFSYRASPRHDAGAENPQQLNFGFFFFC